MTESEYLTKRENYALSSASIEVREKAIQELDAKWQAQQDALVEGGELDDIS